MASSSLILKKNFLGDNSKLSTKIFVETMVCIEILVE